MRRKKLPVGSLFMVFLFLFIRNGIGVTPLTVTPEMLLENFKKEFEPVKPLLPAGISAQPGFVEGAGPVIGMVQMEQGRVYVVHQGGYVRLSVKKGLPALYGRYACDR